MADSKNLRWADGYGKDAGTKPKTVDTAVGKPEPAANDADGWNKYRHWISKAPAPRSRRTGIDPALYSWKGYREWTDQVKRNWTNNNDD